MSDPTLRVAALLFALTALGFGLPCIYGMQSLAAGRGVPLFMGFPSYGGGVFEKLGIPSTVPLLGAFLAVCALELVAAWGLWTGARWGAVLGLALLVPGTLFWIGFSLPIPPLLAILRTILVVARWDQLR